MLWEAFRPDDDDADAASGLSAREIVLLALATSIDALAVGLSFAFLDVPLWIAVVSIGLVTFALSFVAVLIGHRIGTRWRKPAEIIGGIVLIGIGTQILIEHLVAG
ncbi:putative Mn2+ efflux pump MntP [Microbacterium paludicola]|uniref:Mn2+ efflux pump MntP n=2 Tax=Microbacteriaceae TaxID=85023 RepID=A0ABU1I1K9_9MICO|nr:manganese efflux pump [Microbacterium paludicola]MDR6167766.1 putative Mn2+ efflux pump MntP [Microbacterium paludicola]